jgi:hypothetical protein
MAGRVQLVQSVIQSMLIYSITIYSWPTGLLKEVEKNIRNFICSGDVDKRKLVTTSWKKVCRPLAQGSLNIKSLSNLNKAANLKLCWSLVNSQVAWAKLLKDRVLRDNRPITYHIYSSLWSCIKEEFSTTMNPSGSLDQVRTLIYGMTTGVVILSLSYSTSLVILVSHFPQK